MLFREPRGFVLNMAAGPIGPGNPQNCLLSDSNPLQTVRKYRFASYFEKILANLERKCRWSRWSDDLNEERQDVPLAPSSRSGSSFPG